MAKIIELDADALTPEALIALCTGDALAIRISDFVPPAVIKEAEQGLFFHPQKGALGHAQEFTRLGIAYAEIKSDDIREAYHTAAISNIQRVRNIFSSRCSPVDRFRVLLDDVWPEGATLLSVNKKKCFVGVCRYLTPGVDLEPHIDSLEWTLPAGVEWQLKYQLSANMYLQVPEEGGELEIWDILPSAAEYEKLKGSRHYGINRSDMGQPDLSIKPRTGDLIFLNPRFIHAVRPVKNHDRITLSSFVGIKSEDQPVVYWS